MKMIQTDTTFGRPNVEIFYDGQLNVVYDGTYGVVDIPRKMVHWSNELLLRGYVFLEEEPQVVVHEAPTEEVPPEVVEKPATSGKRRVKNG